MNIALQYLLIHEKIVPRGMLSVLDNALMLMPLEHIFNGKLAKISVLNNMANIDPTLCVILNSIFLFLAN
jgi:hypothetical protein